MSTDSFYVARRRTKGKESDYYIEWVRNCFEQPEELIGCKTLDDVTSRLGGISVYSDPLVNEGHLSMCARLMVKNMDSIIQHVEDMTSGKNHSYNWLKIEVNRRLAFPPVRAHLLDLGDDLRWKATWKDTRTKSWESEPSRPFEVSLEDFNGDTEVVDFDYLQRPLEILTCFNGRFEGSFYTETESEKDALMRLLALAKRNLIRITSRMDAFGKLEGYITNDCIDAPERFPDDSWDTSNLESDISEDKAA